MRNAAKNMRRITDGDAKQGVVDLAVDNGA
jgi:hypothetical protein